ncbi:MAG: hypothetical protein PHV37_06680 [Candidatus Gastranaerophilales bacterium]|nr:hypothetical protein [Candidatus Gastranaerophilales bacterium]
MMNNKKAVSLSELLIMISILIIVSTIVVIWVNPFVPDYQANYYQTFGNLKKVVSEMISLSPDKKMKKSDKELCSNILNAIDTEGSADTCEALYPANIKEPFLSLNAENIVDPTFTLANGQRYYLSPIVETEDYYYRILAIDLNGAKAPNKPDIDIVSFVIFENGEILPLGDAAENQDYIKVKVKVFNIKNDKNPVYVLKDTNKKTALTYRQGYCAADTPSIYGDYCKSNVSYKIKRDINNDCLRTNNTKTFCQVNYVKPLYNLRK